MIVNERVREFIILHTEDNSKFCEEIREDALQDNVPIIKRDAESFLKSLLLMKRPARILEVGTAVGYSAILMAEVLEKQTDICTLERSEDRIAKARENFQKADMTDCIHLMEGDATTNLEGLIAKQKKFDFIFMDAAKAQYIVWLPLILQLLDKEGILLSDNVLQDGNIVESRFVIERRDRTIHTRLRQYIYELTHREDIYTSIIPIGDGLSLSTYR